MCNRRSIFARMMSPGSLLLVLLALNVVLATDAAAQSWAEKMFESTKHDFRTVGRGTKAEHHFTLTNLYQEDVHISAVRSSCGCTTPSVTKSTLQTHDKAAVIAKFNTDSHIGGKSATITVVFDKPYYAEVQLRVSGYIRTDVTFDPPEVDFGELKPGETAERNVTITKTGNPSWRITDVRSHCKGLSASLSQPELTGGKVRYHMTVRSLESLPEGDVREQLTLISNDRSFPTTEMAIVAHVRPRLSVSPAAVSIDTVKLDDDGEEIIERRLVVRGEEPFHITDVECQDERFDFELPSAKKKLHFLKMRFHVAEPSGSVATRIAIKTDLPDKRSADFLVTGTVAR